MISESRMRARNWLSLRISLTAPLNSRLCLCISLRRSCSSLVLPCFLPNSRLRVQRPMQEAVLAPGPPQTPGLPRLGCWALGCLCIWPQSPSLDTEGVRWESRLILFKYDYATSQRDQPLNTLAPFSVLT